MNSNTATCLAGNVLIVDDDDANRMMVSMFVNDILAGSSALQAANGEEALALIRGKTPVDLVICDYNMPGGNGVETIKQLRTDSPRTRFILMSGSEANELAHLAAEARADGWLCKPFSGDAFLQQVQRVFAASGHV